jgi:hypothetical protein
MRREAFGAIAAALPERDLAKVLLMAGLQSSKLLACLRGQLRVEQWIERARLSVASNLPDPYSNTIHVRLNLQNVRRFARAVSSSKTDLQVLLRILPELWEGFKGRPDTRYRVTLLRTGFQLDLQWISYLLTASEIGVQSVVNEARHGVESYWDWPLRIGVLPTHAGKELLKTLEKDRYSELYNVKLAHDRSRFDLLLFTGSLLEVKKWWMPLSFNAGALLVLGAADDGLEATTRFLRKYIYQQNSASMAAVCFVPNKEQMSWLRTVVRDLSCNATLDTALFRARFVTERQSEEGSTRIGDLQYPLVFGSEEFLQGARISETAKRIGAAIQSHEQAEQSVTWADAPEINLRAHSIREVGGRLLERASDYAWASEPGGAVTLARIRRKVETQIGPLESLPITVGRNAMRGASQEYRYDASGEGDESPEQLVSLSSTWHQTIASELAPEVDISASVSKAPEEERHVQCKVSQSVAKEASIKRLQQHELYLAQIHIGPKRGEEMIIAGEIFNETLLPPREKGHDLSIVFCPLNTTSDSKPAPPQVRRVHLPKRGDSNSAEFYFVSGAEPDKFRARLIILHNNRIIQTLVLGTSGAGQDLALTPENLVTPFLDISEAEATVDLAFVINDNSAGKPGITIVSSDTASFIEPEGLALSIKTLKDLLSDMNISAVGEAKKLDDEDVVKLMIALANHGAAILSEIENQIAIAPYQSAVRIQVVEAVVGAYLPVEFLYSGEAPLDGAKLCPNAVAALLDGDPEVHHECAHANDPNYVCPAAFWGFSKCIERQSFGKTIAHVFSVPQTGTNTFAPFQTALVAGSNRVDPNDMSGSNGLVTELNKVADILRCATSWEDWQKQVQIMPSPTLLVLLPHSANSPTLPGMTALEIEGSWLESSRLTESYVHPEGSSGPGPLVLLLGCSTALPEIAFLSFVRKFQRSGASIVLGTLATIHGKQATQFAARLIREMKKQGNGLPFDQALLKVKQQMLAEGEPLVMSLAAYGHSSWLIQS